MRPHIRFGISSPMICMLAVLWGWTTTRADQTRLLGARTRTPTQANFTTESIVESGERGGMLDPVGTNFAVAHNRAMGKAMETWNAHQWSEGVEMLRRIYEEQPDSPWAGEAELHHACFLKYNGQFDEAEEHFLSVLSKYPDNAAMRRKVLHYLPHLYYSTGRFTAALETMRMMETMQMTWQEKQFYENWTRTIYAAIAERKGRRDCGPIAAAWTQVLLERQRAGLDVENITADTVREAQPWAGAAASGPDGISIAELTQMTGAKGKSVDFETLKTASMGTPILVYLHGAPVARAYNEHLAQHRPDADDGMGHYAAVIRATDWYVDVLDPSRGQARWTRQDFAYHWKGIALELPGQSFSRGTKADEQTIRSLRGGCCGSPPPDPPKGCPWVANGGSGGSAGPWFPVSGIGSGFFGCYSCGAEAGAPMAAGAPRYRFGLPAADFAVFDTPIWYPAAKGPTLGLHLTHNRVETHRMANYTNVNYHPFGVKWNSNLGSYMLETPSTNVQVILPSGDLEEYIKSGADYVAADVRNYNTLTITDGFARLTINGVGDSYFFSTNTAELYLTRHEDRFGNAVTFQYDGLARLTNVVDAAGRFLRLLYDPSGRVTSVVDILNRTASFSYDADGNLRTIEDMGGHATTIGYQEQHWITNIVYPDGAEWTVRSTNGTGMGGPFDNTALYGAVGNPAFGITVTNPRGHTNVYTYYAFWSGGPISVKDFAGNQWGYSLHPYWSSRDTIAHDFARFTHDPTYPGNPYTIGALYYESRVYDGSRRVSARTLASTDRALYDYAVPDPYQGELKYEYTYDASGRLVQEYIRTNNATHGWRSNHYDSVGNVIRRFDELGQSTQFGYDSYGQLTAITDALNNVTLLTNTAGRITSLTDPRGHTMTWTYGTNGLPSATTSPGGGTSYFQYDAIGRLTSTVDSTGWAVGYEYDDLDRKTRMTFGDGTHVAYDFSCCGLQAFTDRLGRRTTYGRDSLGQPVAITNALGHPVRFGYAPGGALTSLVTYSVGVPRERKYHYTHEHSQTWLTGRVSALGRSQSYRYTVRGWLSERVDSSGRTNKYNYDAFGRLLSISNAAATQMVYFAYDKIGRMVMESDHLTTNRYHYDAVGRVTSTVTEMSVPGFSSVACSLIKDYDANGNTTSLTLRGEQGFTNVIATAYRYDSMNRKTLVSNDLAWASYEYDVSGRLTAKTYGNGDITRSEYDQESRLRSLVTTNVGGIVQGWHYAYDAIGQMTSITNAGNRWLYEYDAIGQLLKEAWNDTNVTAWTYDESGNRLTEGGTLASRSYGYSADDELVWISESTGAQIAVTGQVQPGDASNKWYHSWAEARGVGGWVDATSGAFSVAGVPIHAGTNALQVRVTDVSGNSSSQIVSFTKTDVSATEMLQYDANGNLTNWIRAGSTNAFVYDHENRLTRATTNGILVMECWYDGFGRRIAKRELLNGATNSVVYVYDGWNITAVSDQNGHIAEFYARGDGIAGDIGSIIARATFTNGAAAGTYFYHCNHRGDVTAVRTTNGNTLATWDYRPFGEERSSTGSFSLRFGFSSKEYDQSVGLKYYGFRHHAPSIGRWLSQDPQGDSDTRHLYDSCHNAPLSYFDVLGGTVLHCGFRGGVWTCKRHIVPPPDDIDPPPGPPPSPSWPPVQPPDMSRMYGSPLQCWLDCVLGYNLPLGARDLVAPGLAEVAKRTACQGLKVTCRAMIPVLNCMDLGRNVYAGKRCWEDCSEGNRHRLWPHQLKHQ